MPRKTNPRVATSPGCAPLLEMYRAVEKRKPSRWPQVEREFFQAMWKFDQKLSSGEANQGDNQNGKGDFFTDLIALLLENCSEKPLYGRGAVPGLIFPIHALDASYPETGTVEVLIVTKGPGRRKRSGILPRRILADGWEAQISTSVSRKRGSKPSI
jgi:hypothetical protein